MLVKASDAYMLGIQGVHEASEVQRVGMTLVNAATAAAAATAAPGLDVEVRRRLGVAQNIGEEAISASNDLNSKSIEVDVQGRIAQQLALFVIIFAAIYHDAGGAGIAAARIENFQSTLNKAVTDVEDALKEAKEAQLTAVQFLCGNMDILGGH